MFIISAHTNKHTHTHTHRFLYLVLPFEVMNRGFPQQPERCHEDRVRYSSKAGQGGGEEFGRVEVSQREEGGGEELVAPHDLKTPGQQISRVF